MPPKAPLNQPRPRPAWAPYNMQLPAVEHPLFRKFYSSRTRPDVIAKLEEWGSLGFSLKDVCHELNTTQAVFLKYDRIFLVDELERDIGPDWYLHYTEDEYKSMETPMIRELGKAKRKSNKEVRAALLKGAKAGKIKNIDLWLKNMDREDFYESKTEKVVITPDANLGVINRPQLGFNQWLELLDAARGERSSKEDDDPRVIEVEPMPMEEVVKKTNPQKKDQGGGQPNGQLNKYGVASIEGQGDRKEEDTVAFSDPLELAGL